MKSEQIILNSEFATKRIVLLHGWGADADDLIPVGKLLTEGFKDSFEIVSLSAPHPHPEGYGRQWYPLYPHQWDKVPKAVLDLERRLNTFSSSKIPLKKTLLLGFSQGGAMALELANSFKFGGVFAVGSYPHPNWEPSENISPIFLCHGYFDQVVPKSSSQKSYELLLRYGVKSDLYFFEGGHEINQELIDHCREIIKKTIFN